LKTPLEKKRENEKQQTNRGVENSFFSFIHSFALVLGGVCSEEFFRVAAGVMDMITKYLFVLASAAILNKQRTKK